MKKDLHQTVVVKRPVTSTIAQEDYFGPKCNFVSFICDKNTYVRAGADSVVVSTGEGRVILYAELPTMTVKLTYTGLANELVLVGQHLSEGYVIGVARGLLKFQVTKVLEGTYVAPEFFSDQPEPTHQ
ncbi:MAG: hypothetical protein AB7V39_00465 [Nitrospiraceae bacterium]